MPQRDVEIRTTDGTSGASLSVPDGAGPWPAVIMFPDAGGRMNEPLGDRGVLCVSQFTLYASTKKGARPSYSAAAPPAVAQPLFEAFVQALEHAAGRPVRKGVFGAHMQIALVNDGPVTLWLDSLSRE